MHGVPWSVSETALAARALATELSLGFASKRSRLKRGCALSQGSCANDSICNVDYSCVNDAFSAGTAAPKSSTGFAG